jgi:hypothetical protein
MSINLPFFNRTWIDGIISERWEMYAKPTVIVAREPHPLDLRTSRTPGDNTQFWVSFHKKGITPIVPAEHLMKHPDRNAKAIAAIWSAGVTVQSNKVPGVERAKDERNKMLRVQQLRASSVLKIIHQFTRATTWDPQAIIVDPFMGAGSTAIAARMAGCYFIGVERVAECIFGAHEVMQKIEDVDGMYEPGGGLRTDLIKESEDLTGPHDDACMQIMSFKTSIHYIRFAPETKGRQSRR